MKKISARQLWGAASCLPRTVGVGFLLSLTILLSLYYMATEDSHRYLSLPAIFSERIIAYESIDGVNQGYLVDGPHCRIPNVDPYDREVRRFVHAVPHISCSNQQPLTYVTKSEGPNDTSTITLNVDKHVIQSYSRTGVQCCYSTIKRGFDEKKPDDAIVVASCKNFKESANISEPFVLVKCVTRNRKKSVYTNAHAVINMTPQIKKRIQENPTQTNDSRTLSVLLVGIDSISRLNSIRQLPRTLKYLDINGWTELKGYNKIADNTFPNLMALLTGLEGGAAYNICLPKEPGRLDNCSFVWTKYHDNGYVTAYAEDAAQISTFNYLKVGFTKAPTDYYFRPFMKAIETGLKTVDKYGMHYCVGPVSAGDRILSYAKDFATTFANSAHFGLFWMNTFSHNDLNMPSGMDNAMLQFFEELSDRGVTKNSMIVFFSDHGIRFGQIRKTKIGWLEERLPFIYIYMPIWFREKFPTEFKNLQTNVNRLSTPYDLHMTLQDVLVLSGKINSTVPSVGCPTCHSLFTEINNNRSCEDASISPHWCMCNTYTVVPVTNATVQRAAAYIVAQINEYIEKSPANVSKHCAKLSLNKILRAQVGESWYTKETYYLLYIETTPGQAKYEATLGYIPATSTNSVKDEFKMHGSVSRLDTYANQSYCISDGFLKKYCYCR